MTDFSGAVASSEEPKIQQFYQVLFQKAWQRAPELQIALARKSQKDAERFTAVAKRFAPAVTGELSQVHTINMDENTGTASASTGSRAENQKLDGSDYSDWNLSMRLPLYNRTTSLRMTEAGLDVELAVVGMSISKQGWTSNLRDALTVPRRQFSTPEPRQLGYLSKEHVARIQSGI